MNIKASPLGTVLLCGVLALPAGIGSQVLAHQAHSTQGGSRQIAGRSWMALVLAG